MTVLENIFRPFTSDVFRWQCTPDLLHEGSAAQAGVPRLGRLELQGGDGDLQLAGAPVLLGPHLHTPLHTVLHCTVLYCTVLYSARTRMVSTRARAAIISALSAAAPPPPPAPPRLDTQLLPGHSRAVTALSVSGARARAGGK